MGKDKLKYGGNIMEMHKTKEIKMPLLENGLDFILHGLNELVDMKDKPNNGKYAILHIHAGTELILKARLKEEHWSLIFSKEPDIKAYNSGDFLGIYMDECIKRLNKVCSIVLLKPDIAALDNLRKTRNRIEHFQASYNPESLGSIVFQGLSVLMKFIESNFTNNSFSENEDQLLKCIWEKIRQTDKWIEIRMNAISLELSKHNNIVGCPVCHQKAAILDYGLECLFCGSKIDNPEEAANAYLTDYLGESEYEIVKEGGAWPLYECPNCDDETMVYDEDGDYICFNCGATYKYSELSSCGECGKLIPSDTEIDICDECLAYKINKND